MIEGFSHIITSVFDLLVAPFGSNAGLALSVLSALCGVAMIFLFRATSNQVRIRRIRDIFKARILEMRIYQDDLALIFRALGRALSTNWAYLRASMRPIVVLLLFIVPVFIQLDERYGRSPLSVGDATVLTVTLKDGANVMAVPLTLAAPEGAHVEGLPVRVPHRREINWRVRVEKEGVHHLTVKAYESRYAFPVIAGATQFPLGHERTAGSALAIFLHPTLPPLPGDTPIASVTLRYPPARYALFGWRAHWLVVFIVWSFVGALIPKFVFRIQV
ncbi:MAG: hypothetical protein IH969_05715 [Candidatus Krumholzibacteriota bacterium]|nr:hypothetical protein [Candidatus Krumholzibacteriota bacterium]